MHIMAYTVLLPYPYFTFFLTHAPLLHLVVNAKCRLGYFKIAGTLKITNQVSF